MREFFSTIYEAPNLYSQALGEHLFGKDIKCENYTDNCIYNSVGFSMIIITIILCFVFYKVIDHPRFNKRIHWVIFLLSNAIINFIFAFYEPYTDLNSKLICPDLINQISTFDCINFGIINAFYASLIFFGFSFIFQSMSLNASTTPHKQ